MKAYLISALIALIGFSSLLAQVPQVNHCLLPTDYFVNEEFCFTLDLEETANTGFGPYLRIMLPPGVDLHQASFATSGSTLSLIGVSTGALLKDPHRNSGTVADSVSLPSGWSFYILDYPVGSVTSNGVALITTICLLMDPNVVTLYQPLDIQFQGGYIYGNTPTGSNGPTLGPLWSGQVTPQLFTYKKTSAPLPRHDRTPGPDWPLVYSLTVDIANAQSVTGLTFLDSLPDSLMYITGSLSAPMGCTIDTSGILNGVPGGSFSVSCPSGTGTLGSADVQVQYAGYAVDVLNETIGGGPCDEFKIVNLSWLNTNQGGPIFATDTVRIYNVTFQQESFPMFTVPGGIVTTTIDIQVSDYIRAMDSFQMAITVDDGLDYIGNATLDGSPVTHASITYNYPSTGRTYVVFDLVNLNGGNIMPGDSFLLTYETQVRQTYQATGDQVLARDVLSSYADGHYHLFDEAPGMQGCDYSYKASVAIIPNSITKDVIGGSVYVPGDLVTYRLRMALPSGDANKVIFTDFLPIPVHNVANIDTAWNGAHIVAGPNHNGVAPDSIYTIPANNALVIDFGDVASNSSPESLEVYIRVPVTTVPFANGLIHSNFLQVESDNTQLATEAALQLTQIWIGAPMLAITKGVSAVTNPQGSLTAPGSFPVNSNAINVDANDTIYFVSTIRNIGGAQAFDVKVVDPVPMNFAGCTLIGITNGIGNPYPYHGNLFTAPNDTLVIDSMEAAGPDSIAFISYSCVVDTNAIPWQSITNTMSMAWASAIGQDSLFDTVKDSAFVRIATPQIAKTVRSISPGHTGNLTQAHVGEAIEYVATIRIPEGVTDSVKVYDTFGVGLGFAGIDSIVVSSADISSSLGSITAISPIVDSIGAGGANRDRSLLFNFGVLTNSNNNNSTAETIRIYYKARVLNTAANLRGTNLTNYLRLTWRMPNTGQTQLIDVQAPVVRVAEPTLTLLKEFMTNPVTPGDSVYVTLTLEHSPLSNGTAYDITVTDTLPFGMNFLPGSFSGACPSSFSVAPGYMGGVVSATWDSLEVGASCQFRFKVAVDNAFPSCNDIINRGNIFWQSNYSGFQTTLPACPSNPFGVERTGFASAPGQLNNYNASSRDTLNVGVAFSGIPAITGNAPVCIGNQLELNCTPFTGANVAYIWTTPTGTDTTTLPQLIITNATAADSGYYTVTVSVGGCLSPSSTQFLAAVVPNPVVLATGDGIFCEDTDRQLTAVAYPAGNYNYNWIGPNGFISSVQNPLLTNLTQQMAGNYTVQVSGNGCTSAWAAPVNIQVLGRPVVAAVGDTLLCSYGIVDVIVNSTPVSGTGPFTYYWTGPGGFASTMQNAVIPNAMNVHQGNYIVTMTDSFGCVSQPVTAIVDILDAPQTPVITQQAPLCPGDPLTVVTTPYAGASVSYYWVTPNGPQTTSVPSLNIPSVTVNDAGLYSVVAEIDGCQTLMSALSTVVVNAAPVLPSPTATYNPLNCAGDTLWLAATGDSTHTFLWTGPNGFTGNGTNVYVPNADPAYNGSYEVTASNGNCISTASVTINSILPYPATPSLVQPMTVCEGENPIIQANPYNGMVVNYTWSTPAGLQTTTTPSLLLQPVTMGDSGNYSLSVNVNGCPSLMSGTVYLDVNPAPATPVIYMNSNSLCEGDTLLLSTDNIPGASYQWSGPAGYNSTYQNPQAIAPVSSMNIGVFELFVVVNGCRSAVDAEAFSVNQRPAPPSLYCPNTSICEGEPISLSSSGGCNSHIWVNPLGIRVNTSAPTATVASTDTAYLAGNWTALCVSANGCASDPSAPVSIAIVETPPAPSVSNNAPGCEGNTLTLTASSIVSNAPYSWTGPNGFTYQGQFPVIYNINTHHAGNYGVVILDQGCASDTAWTTVTIHAAPATPIPSAVNPVCAGDTLFLLANATGTDYLWTGPAGFESHQQNPFIANVSPVNSGFYQLTVIQGACSSDVGMVNIAVNTEAQENAFAGDDFLVCNGMGTATLDAGNTTVPGIWTTNSPALIVSPSHPQTLISNLEEGVEYVFFWTLAGGGCAGASMDSVHVQVAQSPLANPNGYQLKDYNELLNLEILLDDSTFLQEVTLTVEGQPSHGTYTTNPNSTINYKPADGFIGQDSLLYSICLKACPEMCDMAWVRFEINEKIVVPDLITPNGDGINDAFEMIGLENFPHNQIFIFNRWGNEVFSTENYKNDWKGTYNGGPVPDGTYFWVLLDKSNGAEIKRGYLTVHR
jgi:gliding motility-associated-like protein/uncharacterized repeat protein (TIGR01451 family)